MHQDITIIYVIYKSGDILYENITKLKNFHKIIIDNDPESTLEKKLKSIDCSINYIKMNKNIGMAKAANIAFEKVKTNFFLYLTADTIINENSIKNLFKVYKKYDSVGLVCPIHLDRLNVYSGNYFCHPVKRILKRNIFQKKIYNSLSKICPTGDFSVNSVWGSPILLKTSIINHIGFFDKNFFMYFEDVDLCDRIKSAGYEIIETPDSFCNHLKGSSINFSLKNMYTTISSFKFSEIYYFSKYGFKYTSRIYLHAFDYFLRIFFNLILFNKNKVLSNIFRLIGILRYFFYKKISKF